MKVTVIICDGCGARIAGGALVARSGVVRVSLDVCEACAKLAVDAIRPPERGEERETFLARKAHRLELDLQRMTRIASEGYRGDRDPIGALGAIVGRGT